MSETTTPKSTPPLAAGPSPLATLAADMMYYKATELLRQMACGANWKPVTELRDCLSAYAELRQITIIQSAQDEPEQSPETARSRTSEGIVDPASPGPRFCLECEQIAEFEGDLCPKCQSERDHEENLDK